MKQNPTEYRYEITQLINSLLGTIVFICENNKPNRSDQSLIENDKTLKSRQLDEYAKSLTERLAASDDYYNKYENGSNGYSKNSFGDLFCHMRNAIAHGRIEQFCAGKEIVALEFRDKPTSCKSSHFPFSIKLTTKDIQDLFNTLASHYGYPTISLIAD